MPDGKACEAHFPDDPAYDFASRLEAPRMPNSAELLAALAALEQEFRTILSKLHRQPTRFTGLSGVASSLYRMRPFRSSRRPWRRLNRTPILE
jgi:hypothetical protein